MVAFGNARSAKVATLGLNPSRIEFLDRQGAELTGDSRRLATHSSLGTSDLAGAPIQTVATVLEECDEYFHRNPYRKWFDQFLPVLKACGASYYDGSACHLDLVQWATDPTWGKLQPASMRKELLSDDAQFLGSQLQNETFRLLLANGAAVLRQLQRTIVEDLKEVVQIDLPKRRGARLFAGSVFGCRIIGWSINLQSSFGVTKELRKELAARVGELAA